MLLTYNFRLIDITGKYRAKMTDMRYDRARTVYRRNDGQDYGNGSQLK